MKIVKLTGARGVVLRTDGSFVFFTPAAWMSEGRPCIGDSVTLGRVTRTPKGLRSFWVEKAKTITQG